MTRDGGDTCTNSAQCSVLDVHARFPTVNLNLQSQIADPHKHTHTPFFYLGPNHGGNVDFDASKKK